MAEGTFIASVRSAKPHIRIIDLSGDLNATAADRLRSAYSEATQDNIRMVIFNFSNVSYINSIGIGVLVTQLIRARRENVQLTAFGLNNHYRDLFALTHLDQVIPIFSSEEIAISSSHPFDRPEREY